MALFRFRSRYGRLVALAAMVTGLYYISSLPASSTGSSSFSISAASMIKWSQHSHDGEVPSFEEPERPRAKLGTLPLKTKHKTRNGRPPRYGPRASSQGHLADTSKAKLESVSSEEEASNIPQTQSNPGAATSHLTSPPSPPPGLHLPDSPGFRDPLEHQFNSWKPPEYIPRPRSARKPPRAPHPKSADVPDPFPLLSRNPPPTREELNLPPAAPRRARSGPETPLLIGFTRNWPQLLQCVVSYLAAGWPAEDIHVVENTGVMYANRDGKLGLQNPFYLNHTQLGLLGVDIIVTPTLLTFAQLQNFYTWTALQRNWTEFFWSHQDVIVFSESPSASEDSTLHARASAVLGYLRRPGVPKWANHFFAYDHLTLVHRDAVLDVGGWDTAIPYYAGDCDMYNRLAWRGYWQGETTVGLIFDVGTVLDDVGALLEIKGVVGRFRGQMEPEGDAEGVKDELDDRTHGGQDGAGKGQKVVAKQKSPRMTGTMKPAAYTEGDGDAHRRLVDQEGENWETLVELARRMEELKYTDGGGWRNNWQLRQTGGQGDPFYRDPEGFETGLRMMIDTGRSVFAEKWGHRGCDIAQIGLKAEDAWRVERDWDPETEGGGSEGDEW